MSKRFERKVGERLCALLTGMGVPCRVTPPRPELHSGCGSPTCCGRHPGVTHEGLPMVSLETPMSGRMLHRLAVKHGLPVKP
jgi:hypothetical protein